MKKILLAIGFIFYIVCTSFFLDLYVCSKDVDIKANTISDYVDAQLAVRDLTNILEEHGYIETLKGKLIFDEDPIGRFEDETQLGYTIRATKVAYVRSYATLSTLSRDYFYNTSNVYKYHAFNRSIIVHELAHVFLFQHEVKGTAMHEFVAYYFGLLSLPPELMHRILEANKKATAFGSERDAFCPLWYFVDYYPAVRAYLYWKHLPPKERKILFNKIVTIQVIQEQRHVGE